MDTNPSFYNNTGVKNVDDKNFNTAPIEGEIQKYRPVDNVTWYDAVITQEYRQKIDIQNAYIHHAAYNGTDLILFSKPKFFCERRIA